MNCGTRVIFFLVGVVLLGGWYLMDNRLKGVVFTWGFLLIGLLLVFGALFIWPSEKEK